MTLAGPSMPQYNARIPVRMTGKGKARVRWTPATPETPFPAWWAVTPKLQRGALAESSGTVSVLVDQRIGSYRL